MLSPDLILHGGKIITLDRSSRSAQAISVRSGHVAAVGDKPWRGLEGALALEQGLAGEHPARRARQRRQQLELDKGELDIVATHAQGDDRYASSLRVLRAGVWKNIPLGPDASDDEVLGKRIS